MMLRYEKPRHSLTKPNGLRINAVSVLFDMERTDAYEEMLLNCGREGDAERIEALLQRCPTLDVNVRDRRNGNTPLMWAASRGHCKVLETLLTHGADLTLVNSQKQTALEMASPSVQKNIIANASSGRKVSNQKLLQAAWMGNYNQVKRLLSENKKDIQVNCTNSEGLTPLLLMTRDLSQLERISERLPSFRPAEVASLLLRSGAESHIKESQSGLTALHMACGTDSKHGVDLVETLLRHGADVSVRDRYEFTPLHCAAKVGSTGAIRALINHSGDNIKMDVQGSAGSTPLHLSAMGGHEDSIKLLLKAGASVTCTDESGQTPIETAKTRRTKAILQGKAPPPENLESQKRAAPLAPVRTPSRLSRAKSFGGMKDLTLPVASLGLQESSQKPSGEVARSPSDGSLELWQHPFFLSPGNGTPSKNVRPTISHANTQLSLAELSASAPLAIAPSRPDSGVSHLGSRNSHLRRSTPARTTRILLPPVMNSKSPAPALFINRQDHTDTQQLNSTDPLMICGRGSTRTFVEDLEENIVMPSGMVPASPVVASFYSDDVDIPDTITEADIESARSSGKATSPKKSCDFLPGPVIQMPRRQLKPLHSDRRRSVKFSDESEIVDVRRSLELASPRLEKKHQRKHSCPDVEADLNELAQSSAIPTTEEEKVQKPTDAVDADRKSSEQTQEPVAAAAAQPNAESKNCRTPRETTVVKPQVAQSGFKKHTVAKMKGPLVAAKPQRTAIKMSSIKGHGISLSDKQQKVDRLKRVAAQPAPEPRSSVVQPTIMKPGRPRRPSKERGSSETEEKKLGSTTPRPATIPPSPRPAEDLEAKGAVKTDNVAAKSDETSVSVDKAAVTKNTVGSKSRPSESGARQIYKEQAKGAGQQGKVVVTSPVKSVNKRKVSAPSGKRRNVGRKKGLASEVRDSSPPISQPEDGTALISGIGWHVHTTANPEVASTSPVYGSPRSAVFASKYPVIGKIGSQDNLAAPDEDDHEETEPFCRGPIDIATPSIPLIEASSSHTNEHDDPTPRNQFLLDRDLSEVALDHAHEVMPPNQEEASLCPPSLQELDELTQIEGPVFDDDDEELPFHPSDSEGEEGDGFLEFDDDDVPSNAAWHRRVEATDYLDLLRKCSRADFVRGDRTAPTPASASKSPADLMTEGQFEQSWQRDSLRSGISTHGDTLRSNASEISSVTTLGTRQLGETIDWKRGNLLGRGAFGRVFCGMTARGELIAVKQMELSPDDRAQEEVLKIQDEIELLKTLQHRNIVQFYGTSRTNNIVNIFMEYLPGGSIASLLNRFGVFEESVFCRYTRQILDGVSFLHSMNIVHRDIKGANLMLMPNGRIKLIDFGCAKRLAQQTSQQQLQNSMQGSPYWMAPEVIQETGHGPKSDCWSIGCTVFEMATTKPPWAHMQPYAAIFAIGSGVGPVPALDPEKFSPAACKFVTRCLTRDPTDRPSSQELIEDPFVAKRSHSRKNTVVSEE